MHFLKILMWVLLAVVVTLFASRNWVPVTLSLWGDIQADVKLPLLLFIFFLIGWLPTWLAMRTRQWSMNRRMEALERNRAGAFAEEPLPVEPTVETLP